MGMNVPLVPYTQGVKVAESRFVAVGNRFRSKDGTRVLRVVDFDAFSKRWLTVAEGTERKVRISETGLKRAYTKITTTEES